MNLDHSTYSPVCVYHACFPRIPPDLDRHLHNTAPTTLHDHLSYLKKQFRMVAVDELAEPHRAGGIAAITFDDGYKSVITHALPVLMDLDIPCTLYINSSSFDQRVFWRDKIRYIVSHGLVEACEEFLQRSTNTHDMSFYRYTKHPTNNSRRMDEQISIFLENHGHDLQTSRHCFDDVRYLLDHPLISYGNHSHSHYVLSSLSAEDQYQEIHRTRQFLAGIPDIRISSVFAVPFGDLRDYDHHTVTILKELGYRGLLLSRQRLNGNWAGDGDLAIIERFMPRGPDMAKVLAGCLG